MSVQKLKSDPIKTILVITVGMLALYFVTNWQWLLITSLIIGLTGSISPYLAKKIDYLWMKLAWILSLIVPNIILSIVFYLFLTPIALLSRLFGDRDPLTLKNSTDTLFKDYKKAVDKASFEKPW
jgi:ABC-type multidrug transport system fused ATPase/permease subunit